MGHVICPRVASIFCLAESIQILQTFKYHDNASGHLLATVHLLARMLPGAKDGLHRLFSYHTNIRSFDAVDLAVARICIGTYVLNLATLKCLLSYPSRLLCSVF